MTREQMKSVVVTASCKLRASVRESEDQRRGPSLLLAVHKWFMQCLENMQGINSLNLPGTTKILQFWGICLGLGLCYWLLQCSLSLWMCKENRHSIDYAHHVTQTRNLKWFYNRRVEGMWGTMEIQGDGILCSKQCCCSPNWASHVSRSIISLPLELAEI